MNGRSITFGFPQSLHGGADLLSARSSTLSSLARRNLQGNGEKLILVALCTATQHR
ncbi:hypothetical protein RA2_02051 [Roseovarius sp. A-2]|nr:hypothetical protein RA2_02051 [Roseovarius sp. A-2]